MQTDIITNSPVAESGFSLNNAKPLNPESFPNKPRPGHTNIPTTIPNVEHLLNDNGVIVKYNVITKKLIIIIPGLSGTQDNADNVAMSHILSLATLNGMATGLVPEFVMAIADKHQSNPVADWINSKLWDGVDRLQDLYDTLVARDDFPEALKQILMYRWLISAIAAVLMSSGFKSRGVLTVQGPQSIGKTAWLIALVACAILREQVIKLDHHLDASNKDSLLTAISHWIVEIGELDSSFKKDIARLKGFLTSDHDKIRKPYARTNSEYPRRTVFYATVNDSNFLVDSIGNTRWWTIPVTSINYQHDIDMQQLFAQLAIDFNNGAIWWLTKEEEQLLESFNRNHRSISPIQERILNAVDLEGTSNPKIKTLTATQMLIEIEIKNPSCAQSKECAAVLRELFGDSKRINGSNKWRVPFRNNLLYEPIQGIDESVY